MECKKQFEKICAVIDMMNCQKIISVSESPVPAGDYNLSNAFLTWDLLSFQLRGLLDRALMKRMTTLSAVGAIQCNQPEPEPEEDEEKKKKKKGKKSKNAKPEEVVEPLIINRETVHDVWL